MLDIVYAISSRRCYLQGKSLIVQTNHCPLKHFSIQTMLSPQPVCRLEKLAPYDFETRSIKEKANKVAESLSCQTTHSNVYAKFPQELILKFKSKMFKVHNTNEVTGVEKYKMCPKNAYKRDHETMYVYESPK